MMMLKKLLEGENLREVIMSSVISTKPEFSMIGTGMFPVSSGKINNLIDKFKELSKEMFIEDDQVNQTLKQINQIQGGVPMTVEELYNFFAKKQTK